HDVDAHDRGLGFGRWAERRVNRLEKGLDGTAGELALVDAEDGGVLAKGGLHNATVSLGAASVVLVQHIDDGVVIVDKGRIGHLMVPFVRSSRKLPEQECVVSSGRGS